MTSGRVLSSRDILAVLVGFDTTSRQGNMPLIEWIEDYLDGWCVSHLRVDYEAGRKTNLYATVGPDRPGGIVLSGHTDVVPVDGQEWMGDPFLLAERDGRLFGRGACDMKGFIAVALAAVPAFATAKLRTPIHLALSCDEEVGCKGVRPLIHYIRENLPRPAAAIVGEPTSMRVVNAHKSAIAFSTEVTGLEAHSSCTHLGINAILVAGELLGELGRLERELHDRGDPSGRFDPPYSTLHVGTISGGTARNIIPRRCTFDWETRLLPGADPEEIPARFADFAGPLRRRMQAVSGSCGIVTERTNLVPGLAPEPQSGAEPLALRLAQANATHAVSYCTEAGLFQSIGIPAVICGPGSIEQAHKPDEFVEISQLAQCEAFMRRLMAHCAA
jgi:acetylornithine deacetylase